MNTRTRHTGACARAINCAFPRARNPSINSTRLERAAPQRPLVPCVARHNVAASLVGHTCHALYHGTITKKPQHIESTHKRGSMRASPDPCGIRGWPYADLRARQQGARPHRSIKCTGVSVAASTISGGAPASRARVPRSSSDGSAASGNWGWWVAADVRGGKPDSALYHHSDM